MPTLYRMLVTAASRMACDEVRVGDYLKDVLYPVQYSTAFCGGGTGSGGGALMEAFREIYSVFTVIKKLMTGQAFHGIMP